MKFTLKAFAVILTVSTFGFGCASPTTRTPASSEAITFGREKLKGIAKTQGDFNLSGRTKDLTVSLSQGTWCYAVYQGGNAKDSTSVIEIKSAVNDQCNTDSRQTASLGSDISLELINPESQRNQDIHRPPLGPYVVAPVTTMQLLAGPDGSTNQWPVLAMKNGVVKFYNDRTSGNSMSGATPKDSMKNGVVKFYNQRSRSDSMGAGPSGDSQTILELPEEFEDIVNDAAKGNGSVIVTLRDESLGNSSDQKANSTGTIRVQKKWMPANF